MVKKIWKLKNKPVNYTTNDTHEVQKTSKQNTRKAHLLRITRWNSSVK